MRAACRAAASWPRPCSCSRPRWRPLASSSPSSGRQSRAASALRSIRRTERDSCAARPRWRCRPTARGWCSSRCREMADGNCGCVGSMRWRASRSTAARTRTARSGRQMAARLPSGPTTCSSERLRPAACRRGSVTRPGWASGSWNRDGTILFGGYGQPIMRVADTGGVPTAITAVDRARHEVGHVGPIFLADGRRFLFLALNDPPAATAIYQGIVGFDGDATGAGRRQRRGRRRPAPVDAQQGNPDRAHLRRGPRPGRRRAADDCRGPGLRPAAALGAGVRGGGGRRRLPERQPGQPADLVRSRWP